MRITEFATANLSLILGSKSGRFILRRLWEISKRFRETSKQDMYGDPYILFNLLLKPL